MERKGRDKLILQCAFMGFSWRNKHCKMFTALSGDWSLCEDTFMDFKIGAMHRSVIVEKKNIFWDEKILKVFVNKLKNIFTVPFSISSHI